MSLKTYKLKLTAISPIHIGTGEEFEPTNYVIDKDENGKDRLYEFDEFRFFEALDNTKKREFERVVSDSSAGAGFRLYKFVRENRNIAKKIAFRSVPVLEDVANEYYENIGRVVQREGGGRNVFNQFKIAKCYTSLNSYLSALPGSSLKGSISTAYQERLYKKFNDYEKVKELMLKPTDGNIFKNFLIADAKPVKQGTFIGYAKNYKRNEETESELKTILQAVAATSEFETEVVCKDGLNFREIMDSCNEHYMPLFKSQFDYSTDEYTRKTISGDFIKKYENWTPGANQFLLRVGKHSGARAVTVDGIRRITIRGEGGTEKIATEETTVWLVGNKRVLPFGWLLCELID